MLIIVVSRFQFENVLFGSCMISMTWIFVVRLSNRPGKFKSLRRDIDLFRAYGAGSSAGSLRDGLG